MSAELTELSDLHMDYENNPERDTADELSMAVGRFLAARDYAGRTGSLPVPTLTLRDRMAILLAEYDPNGLQPTDGELDVIMAVVESVAQTNAEWSEGSVNPTTWRYARDAEGSLARRRNEWASA